MQQAYTIEGDFALIVDQMLKVPSNDQADAMHTGDRYMSRIVSQTPRLKSPAISFIIGQMSTVAEIKTAAAGLVVSNPAILGGTPVFRATRLPVKTLFDYLADGLTLDYFLETFEGVTRDQSRAALRHGWERIAAELAE